jgi:hypothetical protein
MKERKSHWFDSLTMSNVLHFRGPDSITSQPVSDGGDETYARHYTKSLVTASGIERFGNGSASRIKLGSWG